MAAAPASETVSVYSRLRHGGGSDAEINVVDGKPQNVSRAAIRNLRAACAARPL